MKLHQLTKAELTPKKRVGRGIGSGRGKTATRGTKGQKARGKVAPGFIGGTLVLYKKLPFNRGLGNRKVSPKFLAVSLDKLTKLKTNSEVSMQLLLDNKIIDARDAKNRGVKIVGSAKLGIKLTVTLPTSKSAKISIEQAGGKVLGV